MIITIKPEELEKAAEQSTQNESNESQNLTVTRLPEGLVVQQQRPKSKQLQRRAKKFSPDGEKKTNGWLLKMGPCLAVYAKRLI